MSSQRLPSRDDGRGQRSEEEELEEGLRAGVRVTESAAAGATKGRGSSVPLVPLQPTESSQPPRSILAPLAALLGVDSSSSRRELEAITQQHEQHRRLRSASTGSLRGSDIAGSSRALLLGVDNSSSRRELDARVRQHEQHRRLRSASTGILRGSDIAGSGAGIALPTQLPRAASSRRSAQDGDSDGDGGERKIASIGGTYGSDNGDSGWVWGAAESGVEMTSTTTATIREMVGMLIGASPVSSATVTAQAQLQAPPSTGMRRLLQPGGGGREGGPGGAGEGGEIYSMTESGGRAYGAGGGGATVDNAV